jgi:ATP synthase F1 gamma subunit
MRKPNQIEKDANQITTVKDLTGVFESIASTQVAKVKNKVSLSRDFFQLLWKRYSAIRVDPNSRITGKEHDRIKNEKRAFIMISAEAGLSGDIDQRLLETMLKEYNAQTTDIVVLGSHGATQLRQKGIPYVKFFQVPESDHYINVSPIIDVVKEYTHTIVYYEEYVSLGKQDIKSVNLISSMQEMSEDVEDEDVITVEDTIFEPSLDEIADEMETTMMSLALSQTILESGLAQAASRFNAMAQAKKRAMEIILGYHMEFHRAKRTESDRRLREVMVSLKNKKKHLKARK